MLKKEKKVKLTNCDEHSKKLIYELFYSFVFRTAYYMTRDPHASQDVLQETFIKIFRNIDKIDDGTKVKSWIATITTNTAIDYLRKQKKGIEFQYENLNDLPQNGNEQNFTVEEKVEGSFICQLVRDEMNNLNPDHKNILYLKYIHDLKDQEIANLLQLKVATVKTRIHRAKLQLKKNLLNNKAYIMMA